MVQALVAIGLAVGASSVCMAEEKVLDRTFTVASAGLLTVNADAADVSVSGSNASQVVVHMVARGSQKELDEMKFSAAQGDSGVTVEMLQPQRGWFNWGSSHIDAHIEVTVPHGYRVEAKTSGGNVNLENVAGPSRLRTSGGGIEARNVKGGVEGHTSGGDVRLESIEGLVVARTSGGSVRATSVRGDIDASTSGGDVRLLGVDGKISAKTSGGSVQCELVGANRGISASTSGGDVRLTMPKDTPGTLDAEASGGEITSDLPIATTHWAEHRLSGLINGGGNAIYVRTSGGGITLSASR
jgi:hypothetical protein